MANAKLGLLFLVVLCLGSPVLPGRAAKSPAGSLTGVVLDTKGDPVPSARIFWQTADGAKPPHIVYADHNGHFAIPSLLPGLYQLRGEATGMWSDWEHNVLVRGGSESKVTLRLVRESPPSSRAAPQ